MSWVDTTLGSTMGSTLAAAASSISTAEKELASATSRMNSVVNQLNTVLDSLALKQDNIKIAASAGFYFLTLSVNQGSWDTRLEQAANAPPNSGFSAGLVTIVVAADPDVVANGINTITKALTTPLNLPSILTTNDPLAGYDPIVPSVSLDPLPTPSQPQHPVDIWESESAGGIFTGSLNGLVQDNNLAIKEAQSVLSLANQVGQRSSSIQRGLNKINSFISELNETGIYTIILEPGAGGYLTRLQSESGAPPTDSSLYTAGIAIIAEVETSSNIETLVSQFSALQSLMP